MSTGVCQNAFHNFFPKVLSIVGIYKKNHSWIHPLSWTSLTDFMGIQRFGKQKNVEIWRFSDFGGPITLSDFYGMPLNP